MGKILPKYHDGVPFCADECPSYTRRLRKDGQPSQTRRWFCAVDGVCRTLRVCVPAVRQMAREIDRLEGELDNALCQSLGPDQ